MVDIWKKFVPTYKANSNILQNMFIKYYKSNVDIWKILYALLSCLIPLKQKERLKFKL